MKAKWLCMIGLGLAVVCFGLATQSPAAKGGIPGKPGGEDPPPDPDPGLPFTYERFVVQDDANEGLGLRGPMLNRPLTRSLHRSLDCPAVPREYLHRYGHGCREQMLLPGGFGALE